MKTISRETLKENLDRGDAFTLIEVLSQKQYEQAHLPQAINVPVEGEDFEGRIQDAVPDKHRAVVVYCANKDCSASNHAADKMESLGYDNVYDYAEGKQDWQQAGLPMESA